MTEAQDLEAELKVAITTIIQKQSPMVAPHTIYNILQTLSLGFLTELQNEVQRASVGEMVAGFYKEVG